MLDTKRILEFRKAETTYTPVDQCLKILNGLSTGHIVATGYGRKLIQDHVNSESITEILAHALGAGYLFPGAVLYWTSADKIPKRSHWILRDESQNLK